MGRRNACACCSSHLSKSLSINNDAGPTFQCPTEIQIFQRMLAIPPCAPPHQVDSRLMRGLALIFDETHRQKLQMRQKHSFYLDARIFHGSKTLNTTIKQRLCVCERERARQQKKTQFETENPATGLQYHRLSSLQNINHKFHDQISLQQNKTASDPQHPQSRKLVSAMFGD